MIQAGICLLSLSCEAVRAFLDTGQSLYPKKPETSEYFWTYLIEFFDAMLRTALLEWLDVLERTHEFEATGGVLGNFPPWRLH